jgi:hypothetical protein
VTKIKIICFSEKKPEVPNHNSQIPNNIKIPNSNDQNNPNIYWVSRVILSVLNFGHWYLFAIWILVLGIFVIVMNKQMYLLQKLADQMILPQIPHDHPCVGFNRVI